ncbi:MAG: alkaline phosphatase family protein, partial [Micrococcales bacterium]|nr:alkaline phosphatase family protein [Micrococcales bacterium]
MVGPNHFEGSGLTTAALRGAGFRGARDLRARVEATLDALRAAPRALVYLYWGDLDKVGHVHGCESWQWGDELEATDRALRELAARLPKGTAMYVTADHGMVDVPHADRLDVAHEPVLAAGVRHVAGEARTPQLFCVPGAVDDVVAAWRETLGDRAWVKRRAEVEQLNWFGPVNERVRPRIGEIVVAMRGLNAVVDSRSQRPELISLLGLHGSLTEDEVAIPLLSVPPA